MEKINIFWFRRDLRLNDNAGLYHALKAGLPVLPVFIFDKIILDKLDDKADRRVIFIHEAITAIHENLLKKGSTLYVKYGAPLDEFAKLATQFEVDTVYTNHDYEPYANDRDAAVKALLEKNGVSFKTFKDQVIFDKNEIVKDDGKPYTVFTPYSKRWLATVNDFYLKAYPTEKYFDNFYQHGPVRIPTLVSMGFKMVAEKFPSPEPDKDKVEAYDKQRDFPAVPGTTRIGVHLRFGTVSIRALAEKARSLNQVYLKELIWREFYQMILWHFPKVGNGHAFKAEYERISWRNNEDEFARWCSGETGYPIVDAGMRELNETGFMHNRVRMVTASFLSKHLLIDWRWGEAYFASKLLDYDLASNNGGWQWAAGSGCDAAPYFRIFNPYLQTKRFDPKLEYIRRWVPEFEEFSYPKPIVDHDFARKRCLEVYSAALKK